MFDDISITFCSPKAPKVDAKTTLNGFQYQSQNEAKTNMAKKEKWKSWTYHKNLRCQKFQKEMLSCGRRVHLHKSASFEMIFENIQTNHKNYAKMDPETIEESIW